MSAPILNDANCQQLFRAVARNFPDGATAVPILAALSRGAR
jgi:hypothetical protein